MTLYVDADACPAIRMIEAAAAAFHVPVVLLCDEHHVLTSDTSRIVTVASGRDAVAALALGKGAYALNPSGKQYTDENISGLLMDRHLAGKARRSGKHHLRGPARRTEEDDRRLRESLERLLREKTSMEEEADG